jgi:hypothetical protein
VKETLIYALGPPAGAPAASFGLPREL